MGDKKRPDELAGRSGGRRAGNEVKEAVQPEDEKDESKKETGDDSNNFHVSYFCLMMIPPGGGPGPHRHDFEESFTILEGEIETNFRGRQSVVRAGETINIPANAPHSFKNVSQHP